MFAYCGNNPSNNADPSGYAWWGTNTVAICDGGTPKENYYNSSDEAAEAFADQYFHFTQSDGVEYGAVIYLRSYGNQTVYCLGSLQKGTKDEILPNFSADPDLISIGWDIAGFIHTHPNGVTFSGYDEDAHIANCSCYSMNFLSYVVFLYQGKYRLIHGMYMGADGGLYAYPVGTNYLYPLLTHAGDRGCAVYSYNCIH